MCEICRRTLPKDLVVSRVAGVESFDGDYTPTDCDRALVGDDCCQMPDMNVHYVEIRGTALSLLPGTGSPVLGWL